MIKKDYTIGVISDTHGLFLPRLKTAFHGVDLIIHAGDVGSRSILDKLRTMADVIAVRGNMDQESWARILQQTAVAEVGKTMLYVLHDINRDRKSTRLNSSHIPLSRMPSSA